MCVFLVSFLKQKNKIHNSDSEGEAQEFEDVQPSLLVLEEVSPDVCSDVHEIACDEDQNIGLDCFSTLCEWKSHNYANHCSEVDYSVAEDSLPAFKRVLEKNSYISHFFWRLMSENSDEDWHIFVLFFRSKANSNCKTVEKVMDQRRDNVQVSCWTFSFITLQASTFRRLFSFFLWTFLFLFLCLSFGIFRHNFVASFDRRV